MLGEPVLDPPYNPTRCPETTALTRRILEHDDWTQEKLAKHIGVSRRHVARWACGEQGTIPENLKKLRQLASELER